MAWCTQSQRLLNLVASRNNRKGGYRKLTFAHVRQAQHCDSVFGARFEGLYLYFRYQKRNRIRTKTGLDTYLIRIQTRTPLVTVPPLPKAPFKAKMVNNLARQFFPLISLRIASQGYFLRLFFEVIFGSLKGYFGFLKVIF